MSGVCSSKGEPARGSIRSSSVVVVKIEKILIDFASDIVCYYYELGK